MGKTIGLTFPKKKEPAKPGTKAAEPKEGNAK